MDTYLIEDYRCSCGRLLFKGMLLGGTIEIKCPRCSRLNRLGTIHLLDDRSRYLLIINDHGKITNISNSASKILGYDPDELIGQDFNYINPTIPREIGPKLIEPGGPLTEHNHFRIDTFHRTKSGKKIPVTVSLRLHRSPQNKIYVLVMSVLRNIYDQPLPKQTSSNMIVEGCDFYYDIDAEGRLEYLSPSIKSYRNITENYLGRFFWDFPWVSDPEDKKKIFQHFASARKPFRIKNNPLVDYDIDQYYTPRFDDNQKFLGFRILGWVVKKKISGQ